MPAPSTYPGHTASSHGAQGLALPDHLSPFPTSVTTEGRTGTSFGARSPSLLWRPAVQELPGKVAAILQGEACLPQPPRRALTHWGLGWRARGPGDGQGEGPPGQARKAWLLGVALHDSHLGVGAGGRLCPPLKIGTSILGVLFEGITPTWGV